MTFENYWKHLCDRNPQLESSGKMTMTPEAFKKVLQQAFTKGYEQNDELRKQMNKILGAGNPLGGLF